MLVAGALTSAQTTNPLAPDPFVAQVTHSLRDSFAGDTSANGRFVVIESNGDIATEKIPTFNSSGVRNLNARNNEDGNREIFLYDYAQRRIFQITNTKSVLLPSPSVSPSPSPSPSPSVSPSPSPSPSSSPTPTPVDQSREAIAISSNRPMISLAGTVPGAGQHTYTIVFSSNAPVPGSFDGTDPNQVPGTLASDANQELWTYQFTVSDVADLSSGAELSLVDLTGGTFKQITNTPASRAPSPAGVLSPPFVADDNRDASISDDGNTIAFVSTRNLVGSTNTDGNPEIFLVNPNTLSFTQVTNTVDVFNNSGFHPVFNENPSLSNSLLAFVSNGNLAGSNDDDGKGNGNKEIFVANISGTTFSNLRQVTKTKDGRAVPNASPDPDVPANAFLFGRRLSRDGKFLAFESLAADPKANSSTNTTFYVSFVYDVTNDTFAQLGPRPTTGGDVLQFPTFTDYNGALSPGAVLFSSQLNLKTDGTILAANDATGLNPHQTIQVFSAPMSPSVVSTGPFTRLTSIPAAATFVSTRALPSNSHKRIAFTLPGTELGGGNLDGSSEVFYQLSPTGTDSGGTLTLLTGNSGISVLMPSPTASPSVSPSPSPSPTPTGSPTPYVAPGLAAGELTIAQSSVSLAPSAASNNNGSESGRAPALPIELNGVSVEILGAACGLFAVSPTQINFVIPVGLGTNSGGTSFPIVINNNGSVIHGLLVIVAAQPDIVTSTNGPNGRAKVCNITNPATPSNVCIGEPFSVTTDNGSGTKVPTVLRMFLTGVRGTSTSGTTVTVGTTAIVPTAIRSLDLPGSDQIDFILPSTVDIGDLPIVVTTGATSSRTTITSPPHVTITPATPIADPSFFVRQHYLDFLNREPDADGLAFWTNVINSCGSDAQCTQTKRVDVSAAFFLSIEFHETGYLVYRTYKAAYGDMPGAPVPLKLSEFLPDSQEIGQGVVVNQTGWQQVLENNKQAFMSDFVQRPRFTNAFAGVMTASDFVDKLYLNAGVSPSSAPNRAAAISAFGSGGTTPSDASARAQALRLVAEDPLVNEQEFNKAFVLMQYFGYLRRNPNDPPEMTLDFSGYNFWLNKLNQFNGNFVQADMVKSFLVSGEYNQRFAH